MNVTLQSDKALGSDPQFGSAATIEARNIARYRLGLRLLARHNPDADDLLQRIATLDTPGVRPLFYDPVLRNAFEDDIISLENGAENGTGFAGYLRSAVAAGLTDLGPCGRLMDPRVRPWPEHGPTWVWTNPKPMPGDAGAQMFAARLTELLAGTFPRADFGGAICPDADMRTALRRGAALLTELLPNAGAGVLPHISFVGIAEDEQDDGPFHSLAGGDPLPSAVFLAPHCLTDPWRTAETLLHEGLHLKLFDILRTCSFAKKSSPSVPIPWRVTKWKLPRVLFAFHVYCHLLLLRHAVAEAPAGTRARFGRPPTEDEIDAPTPGSRAAEDGGCRTVLERTVHLAGLLRVESDHLTADGVRFVDWLVSAVEPLAPEIGRRPEPATCVTRTASTPIALSGSGYRRAEPVDVCPLPDQRQLVALSPDPPRFRWLNEHAWLIYALSDGGDLRSLRARYEDAADEGNADDLANGLAVLLSAGLIVPNAG